MTPVNRYPEIITYPALLCVFPVDGGLTAEGEFLSSVVPSDREQAEARIRELVDAGYAITKVTSAAWANATGGVYGVAVTVVMEYKRVDTDRVEEAVSLDEDSKALFVFDDFLTVIKGYENLFSVNAESGIAYIRPTDISLALIVKEYHRLGSVDRVVDNWYAVPADATRDALAFYLRNKEVTDRYIDALEKEGWSFK